jgi:uncharacterized protein YunC (DUF1805 family)
MKCNLQTKKAVWKDKKGGTIRDAIWCQFFDVECHDSCIFAQQVKELKEIKDLLKKTVEKPTIISINEGILESMKKEDES